MVAADAGPMQIQWREGAVLRCAKAVWRSTPDDGERWLRIVKLQFTPRFGLADSSSSSSKSDRISSPHFVRCGSQKSCSALQSRAYGGRTIRLR